MKDGLKKKREGETESTAKQATKEASRYNKTKEKQQQQRGNAFRYILHIYGVFSKIQPWKCPNLPNNNY